MDEDEEIIGTLKPGELEEGTQDHQPDIDDKKILKKTLSDLIEVVAEFNGITMSELTGRSRIRRLTDARKMVKAYHLDICSVRKYQDFYGKKCPELDRFVTMAGVSHRVEQCAKRGQAPPIHLRCQLAPDSLIRFKKSQPD